jgi:hypothetical protein
MKSPIFGDYYKIKEKNERLTKSKIYSEAVRHKWLILLNRNMQAIHHTIAHLQFAAALAQTKNCKRAISLPNSS